MKKTQVKKKTVHKNTGGAPKKHTAASKKPVKKHAKIINTDITPFVLLALALLLETCFLLTEQAGAVGALVHKLFFGLFGLGAHLIPIGLLLIAFFYKDLKSHGTLRFKLIMFPILTVVLSVASTLIAQNGLKNTEFSFKIFWESGILSESGGVFGGVLGMLFSLIFGGTAATVIAVIALIALASLSFGKTRLGVWLIFVRDRKAENAVRDSAPQGEPVKAATVSKATQKSAELTAPRRIDTLISSSEPELASTPELPLLSEAPEIPELISGGQTFDGPDYSDGVNADGTLTDFDGTDEADSDPDIEKNLRASYRPADFMEDFGFRAEAERTEKNDVYREEPAPEPQRTIEIPRVSTPAPQKQEQTSSGGGYSPFATIMSREEFFGNKGAKPSYETPKRTVKTSGETVSYSPFADPIASMNAPKRDSADLPPQSYIAAGQEKMWEDMQSRGQAQNEATTDVSPATQTAEQYTEPAQAEPVIAVPSADEVLYAEPTAPETATAEPTDDDDLIRMANALRTPTQSTRSDIAFPGRNIDTGRSGDTHINSVSANPEPVQTAPTVQPTPAPQYAEPVQVAPTVQQTPAPQYAEPVQVAPAVQQTPIQAAAPAPEPVKPTIQMPLENKNSAFDDDIVAPEQEDENAANTPNSDYSDERDPRIINPFSRYTKLRYPKYVKPPTSLLDEADNSKKISEEEIHAVMQKILDKFESFHVDVSITGYSAGPSITRYEVTPGPGVKYKQVTGLSEDIGLALQSDAIKGEVRIVNVPGKPVIGIEVPNSVVSKVSLRSLIENPDFQKAKSKITVCVGLTVSGKPVYMNIDDMPHVLVAGQTKSGKSVAINAMIMSLIYRASPDEVQFIMVDPKQVELSVYNDIPHMVMPVIDDPKRAAGALQWAVAEMERRYTLIKNARVRDRGEYYKNKDQNPDFEYMPQIVIIIDELADLMLQFREHVEEPINRLAAKARACGMHLVIGTQRPSTDIVTGLIKANIPSKIAFRVASNVDSRVILGNVGAEKLLGRGDMLYHPTGSNQIRAQGAFVDTPEIKRVLDFIIENNGSVEYDPEILYRLQSETDKLNKNDKKAVGGGDDDYAIDTADIDFDYLCQAVELVINLGKATTNVIQRHLKIGFNRASNIVDKLEDLGFISKSNGSSKPRDVTVTMAEFLEWKNSHQK